MTFLACQRADSHGFLPAQYDNYSVAGTPVTFSGTITGHLLSQFGVARQEDFRLVKEDFSQQISERICAFAGDQSRYIVSISGPPSAGKSTLADELLRRINTLNGDESAVILPMDGFHMDNAVLEQRGLLARKGAPHTFDVEGFAALLNRLKPAETDVLVPVFDRQLDLARAGGRVIRADHRIVLVEGNYLLLDEPMWARLIPLYDFRVALEVHEAILTQRLVQRWLDHGLAQGAAVERAESNDIPNAWQVVSHSLPADCILTTDSADTQFLR